MFAPRRRSALAEVERHRFAAPCLTYFVHVSARVSKFNNAPLISAEDALAREISAISFFSQQHAEGWLKR